MMENVNVINNLIAVEIIDVKPIEESKIMGIDGKPTKHGKFSNHPYQCRVVLAPDTYTNNGYEYDCPIKAGDIVAIRASTYKGLFNEENYFLWNNKEMHLIRVMEVVAVITQ